MWRIQGRAKHPKPNDEKKTENPTKRKRRRIEIQSEYQSKRKVNPFEGTHKIGPNRPLPSNVVKNTATSGKIQENSIQAAIVKTVGRNVMYAHVLRKWSLAKILMYLLLPVLALLVFCCPSTAAMHLSTPHRTHVTSNSAVDSAANTPYRRQMDVQRPMLLAHSGVASTTASVSPSNDLNNVNTKHINNKLINEIKIKISIDKTNNNNNDNNDNDVPSVPNYSNSQKFTHNSTLNNDHLNNDSNSNLNNVILNNANSPVHAMDAKNDEKRSARSRRTIIGYTKRNRNERFNQRNLNEPNITIANTVGAWPPASSSTTTAADREREEAATLQRVALQMRVKREHIATHRSKLLRWRRTLGNGGGGGRDATRHDNSMSRHNPFPNSRTRKRRFCSARDPTTLAFEAPTVFEGKVRSMSSDRRRNFSVTFEVKEIFKRQSGLNVPLLVRLKFTYRNASECDIYREQFRSVGYVRDELESGKVYILFVNQIDVGNFTILGQPMKRTRKAVADIRIGVNEKYGESIYREYPIPIILFIISFHPKFVFEILPGF